MNELKLYKSKWKAIKVIFMSLVFIVCSLWLLTIKTDSPKWIYWASIIFFGLGSIVGMIHLFDRNPQIKINEKGIYLIKKTEFLRRSYQMNFIQWNFIKDNPTEEEVKQAFQYCDYLDLQQVAQIKIAIYVAWGTTIVFIMDVIKHIDNIDNGVIIRSLIWLFIIAGTVKKYKNENIRYKKIKSGV